jgi:DNA invertase Pin-like site-specific DNA recombinase
MRKFLVLNSVER